MKPAWRSLAGTLWGSATPLGRALVLVALAAWLVQRSLGWLEFGLLAVLGLSVLAAALILVWVPQPARARLRLRPSRLTAGEPASAEVVVSAAWLPLLSPTVRLQVAGETRSLRLPLVMPGAESVEDLDLPLLPRGVHVIGPLVHERADPLGLLRRRTKRAEAEELLVRPVTTRRSQQARRGQRPGLPHPARVRPGR